MLHSRPWQTCQDLEGLHLLKGDVAKDADVRRCWCAGWLKRGVIQTGGMNQQPPTRQEF